MLGKVVKELTKIHENEEITSENVLPWAKRFKVQRAQSAIINNLTEVNEFDKLKEVKNTHTRKALEDTPRQKHPQSRHANTMAPDIP